jgi:hypothetical protein
LLPISIPPKQSAKSIIARAGGATPQTVGATAVETTNEDQLTSLLLTTTTTTATTNAPSAQELQSLWFL